MFVFDETFTSFQGYGSSIDLRSWLEPQTSIKHLVFRCGSAEELLIVDDTGRARVFSLVTQSFRYVIHRRGVSCALTPFPLKSCLRPTGCYAY